MNSKISVSGSVIKKLNNRYKGATEITQQEWIELDECECGGPLFKFHDVATNIFVVKCGHVKETLEFETKTKKKLWFISKKQPCGFMCICINEKPDYSSFKKQETVKEIITSESVNKKLEENLRDLFKYYFLNKRETIIQEINLIVKYKLFRKPRITYYLPTTELLLRESHKESIEDYRTRIFSIPIVDKSITKNITNIITNKMNNVEITNKVNEELITDSEAESVDSDNDSDSDSEPVDSEPESVESENKSEQAESEQDENSVTDFGDFGSDVDDGDYDDFGSD
jgi:hypothetical protein